MSNFGNPGSRPVDEWPLTSVPVEVRRLFLETAEVVVAAISSPAVADTWAAPSVLEQQTVGGLAGHLARGGVWVVGDYLDGPAPDSNVRGAATFVGSAAEYYREVVERLDAGSHADIRRRGAAVGDVGSEALAEQLRSRVAALEGRLQAEPEDRQVAVAGGSIRMALDDYLVTRLVEQVVHLDDLARSVGVSGFGAPAAAAALVLAVGVDIGRARFGSTVMLRVLYRGGADGAVCLPVL